MTPLRSRIDGLPTVAARLDGRIGATAVQVFYTLVRVSPSALVTCTYLTVPRDQAERATVALFTRAAQKARRVLH